MYTSAARTTHIVFTSRSISPALPPARSRQASASAVLAIVVGWIVFGLRGPYFAIGTLGVAVAGAELIASWEWVGAASGISLPVFPGEPETQKLFFYFLLFGLAFTLLLFLRWLYSTNFGLAINAIRDDEEKAEAMGLHTSRYKRTAWVISAFFLGIAGAIFGNMTGFIEPRDIAFPTTTFNIFMVLMVLLGGKGTLWGPVVGAVVFHVIKEVTWTYFLGWQFVTLGLLIVIIIVYFQQGIVGWLMEKYPERFGIQVAPKDEGDSAARAVNAGLAPHPGGRGMSDAIIEVENVSKSFGGVIANRGVSLSVPRGSITGLIGPNGSGKTTLFNSIVGYHPIDSGSIRFEGREISTTARAGDRAARPAAHVPDHAHLRQDELHAEHADLDPASQGGLLRHVRARARRGGGPRRAATGLRRALREAVPARRQPVVRPAEAPGVRHGADERAHRAAARRADRRHQSNADQRPDRPPQARQHRIRHHAVHHRAQHARDHEHGEQDLLPGARRDAGGGRGRPKSSAISASSTPIWERIDAGLRTAAHAGGERLPGRRRHRHLRR